MTGWKTKEEKEEEKTQKQHDKQWEKYIFIRQWMCYRLSVEYVYSFTKKHNKTTEEYPLFRMKGPRRNRLTTNRYSNSYKHCSRRRLTRFKKGVSNTQEEHVLER